MTHHLDDRELAAAVQGRPDLKAALAPAISPMEQLLKELPAGLVELLECEDPSASQAAAMMELAFWEMAALAYEPPGELVELVSQFVEQAVAIPEFVAFLPRMYEAIGKRADRRAHQDTTAREIRLLIAELLYRSDPATGARTWELIGTMHREWHQTSPATLRTARHHDFVLDEGDGSPSGMLRYVTETVSSAFNELAELYEIRLGSYVGLLFQALAGAGLLKGGEHKASSIGKRIAVVNAALEREGLACQEVTFPPNLAKLRNAAQHMSYAFDIKSGQVKIDNRGKESWYIELDLLEERVAYLRELLRDGGSLHRAVEGMVVSTGAFYQAQRLCVTQATLD